MAKNKLGLTIEISKSERKKIEKKIQRILDKKMKEFQKRFAKKAKLIAEGAVNIIKNSDVVDFIKGDGKGELGIQRPSLVLSKLYKGLRSTSKGITFGKNNTEIFIGLVSVLRILSTFIWTTSDPGVQYVVNLFSLIENEKIDNAGWTGKGIKNAAYVPKSDLRPSGRKFSRTKQGLMISLKKTTKPAYKLPNRYLGGFTNLFTKEERKIFYNILEINLVDALIASDIKVKGKRLFD